MFIITVIPIGKAIGVDELSYFSSKAVEIGSLVLVPVRRKKLWAVVSAVSDVKSQKGAIRNADFILKKTDAIETKKVFSDTYVQGLTKASSYFAQTLGALIYATCSQKLLAVLVETEQKSFISDNSASETQNLKHKLILCPTIDQAKNLFQKSSQENKLNAWLLTGKSTNKEIKKVINAVRENNSAQQTFIITGSMLGFPFGTLESVTIIDPNSPHYISISKPYINSAVIAQYITEASGAKIIKSFIDISNPSVNKLISEFTISHQQTTDSYGDKKFNILTEAAVKLIGQSDRSFILANRLGYGTYVVCTDCGTAVTCSVCNSNMKLYSSQNTEHNMFVCHACGIKRSAHETCKACGGWNLKTYGLGIEKVEEEVKKAFPKYSIYMLQAGNKDADKEKAIAHWLSKKNSILIGTNAILEHLYMREVTCNAAVVVSGAQLLHAPTLFSYEQALDTIYKLKTLVRSGSEHMVIQSISANDADTKSLVDIQNGNAYENLEDINDERSAFNYPPFGTLIVIEAEEKIIRNGVMYSIRNKKRTTDENEIDMSAESLFSLLKPWNPLVFPIVSRKRLGKSARKLTRIILKLPLESWNTSSQDQKLLNLLSKLPPSCSVKINPHSLISG